MHRWARLPHAVVALLILNGSAAAQVEQDSSSTRQSPANQAEQKQAETDRQAALGLLQQVLAGVKSLTLPQNRIAIEAEAFPLVWNRNEAQARTLVSQITGEFAQVASQQDQSSDFNAVESLRGQRQMLVQTIAQSDALLALQFLSGTRGYVHAGSPEEEEAEERALRLSLAAQEASRNPRHALELAEKDLQAQGDLPYELINLLNQVFAGDNHAGAQLLRDIVSQVKNRDLSNNAQDFNFAVNLLSTRNNDATRQEVDDSFRALADSIASAAAGPSFPQNMLFSVSGIQPVLQELVPGKAQAIQQKLQASQPAQSADQKAWQAFNQAQATGNADNLLAVAAQAPAQIRPNLYQQVAWKLASDGDYERACQIAENVSNPFQRRQMLQQALRQAVWAAGGKGDFASAQRYAGQITPEEDRATTLAQLAVNAAAARQPAIASQLLEQAVALVGNHPQNAPEFAAQLQVARSMIQLKSARAVQILERSANQLEQVLGAAVQVDGFLPYQRSFEQGELVLNSGFFFSSLIGPYVEATAQLANFDLPTARTLADRLPFPEARLMAELAVARSVLNGGEATGQVVANGRGSARAILVP